MFNDFAFLLINTFLTRLPSRTLRMFFYSILSGGRISRKASIGMNVKILDIRGVTVGAGSNINFGCILDGRGSKLIIGKNCDIAPQVNIWTLEHNPSSDAHEARAGEVTIEENVWIGNRALILPGTHIKKGAVIAAGSVFKGEALSDKLYAGVKAQAKKDLVSKQVLHLTRLRRFR